MTHSGTRPAGSAARHTAPLRANPAAKSGGAAANAVAARVMPPAGNGCYPSFAMRCLMVALVAVAAAACAQIKYSYDVQARFSERKSYAWVPTPSGYSTGYGKDRLVDVNVQAFADEILSQKGFTRASGNSDLMMSVRYDFDSSYTLRRLDLYVYATDTKELLWRGTAFGAIATDAAAGDLKSAVQGIVANFPPH